MKAGFINVCQVAKQLGLLQRPLISTAVCLTVAADVVGPGLVRVALGHRLSSFVAGRVSRPLMSSSVPASCVSHLAIGSRR
jgi:hypothetical protein